MNNENILIRDAAVQDVPSIKVILQEWFQDEELEAYIKTVEYGIQEVGDAKKFDYHYYVACFEKKVIGVGGIRKPHPKLKQFTHTENPAGFSMLYVTKDHRGGKGVGSKLFQHMVQEVKNRGYTELVVRSSILFKESAWGFYDKMPGLERVGQLTPPESKRISQIWVMKFNV